MFQIVDSVYLHPERMNDNLAAIFEAKLKAAIDNQEPQKSPIFKHCFQP